MTHFSARASTSDGRRVVVETDSRRTTLDLAAGAGGPGQHPTPEDTLLAALGGCTAMTLHLYAKRKGWPLGHVRIAVDLDQPGGGQPATFRQTLELEGELTEEMRARLLEIAGRCPVHRILEGPLQFAEAYGEVPA